MLKRNMKYLVLPVILLAALLFARGEAGAWSMNQHWQQLTQPLLTTDRGWTNATAVDQVVNCNLATDIADMAPHEEFLVGAVFRASDAQVPTVQAIALTAPFNRYPFEPAAANIATHGFHFDNLFNLADNTARWNALKV